MVTVPIDLATWLLPYYESNPLLPVIKNYSKISAKPVQAEPKLVCRFCFFLRQMNSVLDEFVASIDRNLTVCVRKSVLQII